MNCQLIPTICIPNDIIFPLNQYLHNLLFKITPQLTYFAIFINRLCGGSKHIFKTDLSIYFDCIYPHWYYIYPTSTSVWFYYPKLHLNSHFLYFPPRLTILRRKVSCGGSKHIFINFSIASLILLCHPEYIWSRTKRFLKSDTA